MNPYDSAHALAAELKKSSEYQGFLKAYRELNEDTTAKNILDDLREIQVQIQTHQIKGEEIPAEKEEKHKKLSEAANLYLTVKNFIEAEYRLAVLIRDIQKIIADAIDVGE